MFLIYLVSLFCLVVILPKSAVCKCLTKQVVQHGDSVTLTFNLLKVPYKLIQVDQKVNADERGILVGRKGDMKLLNSTPNSLEILVNSIEELSFKLNNVSKNDLGKYCVDTTKKEETSSCCIQLFVTDMPIVSLRPPPHQPVLRFDGKRMNKMSLTCKAVSTTKPDNHNLSMIYTWFKNGVYYGTGNILHDNHVDITYEGASIVCVATDDPECKTVLKDLTAVSTINVATEDRRCTNVLGVSKPFTVRPLYGPDSITLQPARDDIKPMVGSDLSVDCTSNCNPPCNITWYKDGELLNNNKQLDIPALQVDDDGLYMCFVNNIYGNINASFNVNFERKEGPLSEPPTKQPNEPPSEPPSEPPNDDNIIWVLYIGVPVFIITMIIVILTILFTYNKKRKTAIPLHIPTISDMVVADWPRPEESMGYVFTNRIYQGGSNN